LKPQRNLLRYYGNRMLVHVVAGARVTILIDSRTAKANEMLHSIDLAKIVQDNKRDN
jgi:hypothetical protein